MPDYTAPTISGIVYSFKTGGYSAPTISGVPFQFGLRPSYQQTADLKSVIEASPKYCDTTYTYEKDKQTYVVGYGSSGVQILKGRTIYGGIRDLCTYVYGNPHHADLGAFIRAQSGQAELGGFLRPNIRESMNLGAIGGGHPPGELGGNIHGFDTRNLGGIIGGWAISDLKGLLNVIELRNLPAFITGDFFKGSKDLGAFAGGHHPADLGAFAGGHPPADLGAYIYAPIDLPAYLFPVYAKNLGAIIRGSFTEDLGGLLNPVPPSDLPGLIHGWAIKDLGAILNGVYGPYDIQSAINAIPPKDLGAFIGAFKGIQIPFNLQGILESFHTSDLGAVMEFIHPADLGAIIEVAGSTADLGAEIRPKTIWLKKALYVPLLEHKDLWAVINFQCFYSDYRGLPAYLYPLNKSDLPAYVIGWYSNMTADTIIELAAYIGVEKYSVQDRVDVRFVPDVQKSVNMKLRFGASYVHRYKTWDTIETLLIDPLYRNLNAVVTGTYRYSDIAAEIYGEWDWNYSQLPENISPRSNVAIIDFDNLESDIRIFVELMFNKGETTPYKYFYVDGNETAYRIDTSRHWTLYAESYIRVEESFRERARVRNKTLFRLHDYSSVDEAVRDLIDKVSMPSRMNLGAFIDGGMPPHLDMGAYLYPLPGPITWSKNLHASITSS